MADVSFNGGTASYSTNPGAGTVTLGIPSITNTTTNVTSGTLRLELWAFTTPYNGSQTSGYQLATDQLSSRLGPNQYFSSFSATVSLSQLPAGTYYTTLFLTEYTGASTDNGFSLEDWINFPGSYGMGGSNSSSAGSTIAIYTASQIAVYTANQLPATPIVVSDNAANVVTNLDALQTLYVAGKLSSIALTDGGTPALSLSAVKAGADAGALLLISNTISVSITDIAANVVTNLSVLQSLAAKGELAAITLSDGGTPKLSLAYAQWSADSLALAKIGGNYSLAITGVGAASASTVLAQSHVTSVTVSDLSVNIAANLAALQSLVAGGKLTSITLTDGGTPVLSLTAAQLAQDASALYAISGSYTLSVSGISASIAKFVMGEDAIRIAAGLPSGWLYNAGTTNGANQVVGWQTATLASSGANTVLLDAPRSSYALQIDATGHLLIKDIGVGDANYGNTVSVSNDTYVIFNGGSAATRGIYDQAMFVESGANATIARLYAAVMGRQPDLCGLEQWITAYNSGAMTLAQIEQYFVGSAEFAARYPSSTDASFVNSLYLNTLLRAPDSVGLNGWVAWLSASEAAGASVTAARAQVVNGFMTSQEFINDTAPWLADTSTGGHADAGVLIDAFTVLSQAGQSGQTQVNTALIDPATATGLVLTTKFDVTGSSITVHASAAAQSLTLSSGITNATIQNTGETVYTGTTADTITVTGNNTVVFLTNAAHDTVNVLGGTNTAINGFSPGSGMTVTVANTTSAAAVQILNGATTPVSGAGLAFSGTSGIVVNVGALGDGSTASVVAAVNRAYQVADKAFEHVTFMGQDSAGNTQFWYFGSTAGVANGIVPAGSLTGTADLNGNHQVDANEIVHIATLVGVGSASLSAADLA